MDRDQDLDRLLRDYRERRLTRRGFMQRALALGLSLPAISGLLLAARSGAAEAAPAAADTPKTGGTLREGYDLDFSRMDPIATDWYDPGFYALYEAVITNDPDGNFVPQIAEKWEVSPDGKQITFHIRPGLKFHTGAPLDAKAIKDVYDTIQDPKSGSPLASLFAPVASTEAPDETTVVLTMKHPYFEALNVVKTGYWDIVNTATRAKVGAAEYGKKEIDGSGPFTFVEWVPGSHVTVKRWEDYPGSVVPFFQNKGKAYLDGIRWDAILEAAQRAIRIENKEIDTLHGPALQDVARLRANPDLNVIALKEWSGYIFSPNETRTELDFQDLRMRQAMSHAINRPAIVKALLFGEGEPLYGPINTADKYYTKDVEQYNQFDLDKAKSLVAELGWKPGSDGILTKNGKRLAFKLEVQAESLNKDLATAIQAQLKTLGMDVKLNVTDRGTYFNNIANNPDSVLFYYLWPVPIDVVSLFVTSDTIPNPNWAQARIKEVDDAFAAWQSAANEDQLKAAGAAFQVAVAKNLPTIPLVNRNNIWVQRKNVHGWLPNQPNLYPYYNDVWLS